MGRRGWWAPGVGRSGRARRHVRNRADVPGAQHGTARRGATCRWGGRTPPPPLPAPLLLARSATRLRASAHRGHRLGGRLPLLGRLLARVQLHRHCAHLADEALLLQLGRAHCAMRGDAHRTRAARGARRCSARRPLVCAGVRDRRCSRHPTMWCSCMQAGTRRGRRLPRPHLARHRASHRRGGHPIRGVTGLKSDAPAAPRQPGPLRWAAPAFRREGLRGGGVRGALGGVKTFNWCVCACREGVRA